MERVISVPAAVTERQRRASDPRASVWVQANAGSGKTHVLTQRVMRLLLTGVRPEEILCLTYTKAAAAEMRRRVAQSLAEWALQSTPELIESLTKLEGQPPAPTTITRARTLFAHALETPGGLKINTIHAFCEAVLHRFPLEAGVPFDFSVVEDVEAQALIRRSREAIIADGLRGASSPVAGAVETLFGLLSDHSLNEAIDAALGDGRRLREVLADIPAAKRALRQLVGFEAHWTSDDLRRQMVAGAEIEPTRWHALGAELGGKPDGGNRLIDKLVACSRTGATPEQLQAVFFAKNGSLRPVLTQALRAARPDLAAMLDREQGRVVRLLQQALAATLVERSEALLDLLNAIVERYETLKRARSWLDFDDLVEGVARLFGSGASADWVRYKLDAGITHILVDESQDTNAEQWRVITYLQDEFFAGDGAVERRRTLFGVGDTKQSIFSFQGARPELFGEFGRIFGTAAAAADQPFDPVRLDTSFRTLPAILEAVDLVFGDDLRRRAVLADEAGVQHGTVRPGPGGRVILWPLTKDERTATTGAEWPRTVEDVPNQLKSAPRRLAERMASEIRGWLDERRELGSRGRAVRAEDVLILVQQRSALFTEIIRALGVKGIATPGADRLPVTTHIAVLDLMALGDVLTNTQDSLQLAAVLRSPLFDLTEDDLFAVAASRDRQTLWQALESSPMLVARSAFEQLRAWRSRLDFGRPFEFYADILYRDGGLQRFHSRMGGEIDDVMVEFLELALAHEQSPAPSLQGFLAEMRAQEVSIKRDLAEPGRGVRVMTVHGAKGLEAPIVILADAATKPAPSLQPRIFFADPGDPPLFVHAPNKESHTAETARLRDAAAAATDREYWRKLYVGMTRAEDELYITGYLTRSGRQPDGTWFEAVEGALAERSRREVDAEGNLAALVFPATAPKPRQHSAADGTGIGRPVLLSLPPLSPPPLVPLIRPSMAYGESAPVFATAVEVAAITADEARLEGIALHALLQHLGRIEPADWPKAVERALPQLLPQASSERRVALGRRAISIRSRPEFAELFGPRSRAEVPFLVEARRDGKPVRLAGRIDRILVAEDHVLVVDYKSDAFPPGTASEVPASYVMQVGLYAHVASQLFPELAVQAGILWTNLESLMILPSSALRDAVSAFTMR